MDTRLRNTKVERMGHLYLFTDAGLLHLYYQQSADLRHWIRINRMFNACIIECITLGDAEGTLGLFYNREAFKYEMLRQCAGIFDVKTELASRGVKVEQMNDFEGGEFLGPALKFL